MFYVIDYPPRGPFIGDLESRQRMLEWIWDYGNERIEGRLKYEGENSPGLEKPLRLLTNPGSSTTIEIHIKNQNQAGGKTFA